MISSHRTLLAAALLGTLAALPAWAQSGTGLRAGQFYVGGSVGLPDWRTDHIGSVRAANDSGTGLKVHGGYAFSPNVALELGAVHLGKLSGAGGEAKADGVFVDAVGLWPVTPEWTLLGRLGVVNTKVRGPQDSDRGTGAKLGLGVQYNLNATTSIRGEWERYSVDAFGDKPRPDLYSVGINYAF